MSNYFTSSLAADVAFGLFEEARTVNESADKDKGDMYQVTLRCPWANRRSVVDDILGYSRPYPRFSSGDARARTAAIVGDGTFVKDGSLHDPEVALITITYGPGPEDVEGNIISETLEPSAEFLTNDHRQFRWSSASGDKLVPEEAPGKLIIGLDYVQTRYNLGSLPVQILLPGICNNGAWTAQTLGLTFAIETLLYVNSIPNRTITTGGTEGWNMTSRASFRPNGWNKFWRAKTQSWESMYIAGGAEYKNFPPGDFSDVFI